MRAAARVAQQHAVQREQHVPAWVRGVRRRNGRWVQEHATNGMTTFLVHNRMRRRRHNRTVALADADFERALAALAEFDVVGRTEQLDEFLRAVAARMRWTPPAATAAANPTPRAQRHDLSEEERAWVHNRTALDAELVSSLCEERGWRVRELSPAWYARPAARTASAGGAWTMAWWCMAERSVDVDVKAYL